MHGRDFALFRTIDPRRGLHVRRWGPRDAERFNRLTREGLILWETSDPYPGRHYRESTMGITRMRKHLSMKLTLTPKGQRIHAKL